MSEKKYCIHCGTGLPKEAEFCSSCGKTQESTPKSSESVDTKTQSSSKMTPARKDDETTEKSKKNAGYCKECKKNVWIKEDGSCKFGHPAESIVNKYHTKSTTKPTQKKLDPLLQHCHHLLLVLSKRSFISIRVRLLKPSTQTP